MQVGFFQQPNNCINIALTFEVLFRHAVHPPHIKPLRQQARAPIRKQTATGARH